MLEVMKYVGAAIGGIVAGLCIGKLLSKKEQPAELVVRVWADEARKSRLLAREIVRWDGKGWAGGTNGFSVDVPANVPAKEEALCDAQEPMSSAVPASSPPEPSCQMN